MVHFLLKPRVSNKFLLSLLAVTALPCLAILEQAHAFDCLGRKGTCRKPSASSQNATQPRVFNTRGQRSITITGNNQEASEVYGSDQYCVQGNDPDIVYCSFFQCDASGEVIMSESSKSNYMFPFIFVAGDAINMGIARVIDSRGPDVVCYANCCYEEGECGKLLGELNTQAGCRNKCCPTHGGFLQGDCSDTCSASAPTTGDFPGDGDVGIDFNTDGYTSPEESLELPTTTFFK